MKENDQTQNKKVAKMKYKEDVEIKEQETLRIQALTEIYKDDKEEDLFPEEQQLNTQFKN